MSWLLAFGDLAGQRRPHPVHEQHVTENDNQATRVPPAAIRPGGRTDSGAASPAGGGHPPARPPAIGGSA